MVGAKGLAIPIVGLGTWALRGRDCARIVEQAIRLGYRHIDTAQMYDNEREVGEGVRASGKRSEVVVTTKVQPTMLSPPDLERSVEESLAKLRLDVIDSSPSIGQSARAARRDARHHGQDKTRGFVKQIGVSNSPWRCSTRPTRRPVNRWSATRSNAIPISTSTR